MELQKLPIGEQDFETLRRENRLYIDKTELICQMIQDGTYYFLSRPRRFGKQQTWLTFPNKEVNEGFFRFLLPYYSSVQKNRTKAAINSFVDDLRSGNTEQFLQRLQSFFADFQYDAQTTPESHFRNVLYILCKLMGLQVDAEYRTSDGRIDLLLRTDKFVYIIECKIDSTAQVALNQIKEKDYALPWALDGREIVLIGLNFSTNTRRPDDWIVERGSTQVGTQVSTQVRKLVIALGKDTCKITEMQRRLGINTREYVRREMIVPATKDGYVAKLYPNANSSNQAYYLTPKGLELLKQLTE